MLTVAASRKGQLLFVVLLSIKVVLSNSFKLSTFEKCNDVIWFASVVLCSTSRDWLLFIWMTLPHIKPLVHALNLFNCRHTAGQIS